MTKGEDRSGVDYFDMILEVDFSGFHFTILKILY